MIRAVLKRGAKFTMENPGHIAKMTRAERRTQMSRVRRSLFPGPKPRSLDVGAWLSGEQVGRSRLGSVGQAVVMSPTPSTWDLA